MRESVTLPQDATSPSHAHARLAQNGLISAQSLPTCRTIGQFDLTSAEMSASSTGSGGAVDCLDELMDIIESPVICVAHVAATARTARDDA